MTLMRCLQGAAGAVSLSLLAAPPQAVARERPALRVPVGWSIGRVRIEERRPGAVPRRSLGASADRALTVRRDLPFGSNDSLGDPVYQNVRFFHPVPSIDSGVQLPYGLDGIGGSGSDLGVSAGQDASVYVRGP